MSINNWHPEIKNILKQEYMLELKDFLEKQKNNKKIIFPHSKNWFKAFELTPFDKVKVIILGQDPYHGENQAHGLSFSVSDGVQIPPSLKNIFKELEADLKIAPGKNGNLESWAKQGVLLLNSILTVEKNQASSHANKGWEEFTTAIINVLNSEKQNLVFMLWGKYAQQKADFIDKDKHLALVAAHPSPFSAYSGFFGSRHFSKANNYLKNHNKQPINWQL